MSKRNKVTIEDVASEANVSIATVSRVINEKDKVGLKTKEKVIAAINLLGFEIKKTNSLSDNNSKTILVCLTELKNPFIVPVIDGIQNSAHKNGYDTFLLQTKNLYVNFKDYESVLKSQKFAGVVFLSSVTSLQLKIITEQLNYRCPTVFCSEYVEDANISYTCIDDVEALYKSTSFILSCDRSKIAFFNCSFNHNYARRREIGFRKAMEDNQIPINEHWMFNLSTVNYSLAYSSALDLLSLENRPDAIVCASDMFALGIIKACKKKKLKIPEDIAIIGFDNIDLTVITDPPLTTIAQPSYQLGYKSCELLVEKINNPETPVKRIVLETELIVRESTPITIKKGGN
ncbi:MAG: LacI family DNA-binding transcriptional regulator [Anaerorhabdus sp.]